jgi:NAD(P)-dependent dehydrogenase (short-subunit alcohol dehydrogenase family)
MIDMASTIGLMPDANMTAYAATKTAIHGDPQYHGRPTPDMGTEGVTVNPISRGLIASGTIQQMLQDRVKNQGWPADPEQLERKAIAAWAPNPFGRWDGWRDGRFPRLSLPDSRWSNQDWRVFAKEVEVLHLRDSHEDLKRMEDRSEQVSVLPSSRTVPGRRAKAVALRLILPWSDRGPCDRSVVFLFSV